MLPTHIQLGRYGAYKSEKRLNPLIDSVGLNFDRINDEEEWDSRYQGNRLGKMEFRRCMPETVRSNS